jgi:hypothetical protein
MNKITQAKSAVVLIIIFALMASFSYGAAGTENGKKLVLVENGVAKCVIVAADGLSPSEKTGLQELQKYLKEMSGAAIEVKRPEQATFGDRATIVFGNKTVRTLYPDVKLDDLGKEGFILKTTENSLLVAGGEQRGSMYAAYELLEKLGVRWWAVGETYVPKNETVTVAALNERQIPKLEYRDALYLQPTISDDDNGTRFSIHNKMNGFSYKTIPAELGGRFWYHKNLVHSHAVLMQPTDGLDGRFETHPEYWALRDGKRTKNQVCPSLPEVYEIMKANLLKQIDDNPQCEFVVVGQEDNFGFCQCEQCTALAKAEEAQGAANLVLANKLGEMLEKERPGKFIMAPAYQWTRTPPKNLKPHRNVGIVLCSIECDFSRPLEEMSTPSNKAFAEDIIKWGKIAPKLYVWDYVTDFDHYFMPFPNLDSLIPNIKFFVKHGARGLLEQGSHKGSGAEFSTLRNWVLDRAMWNPDQPDNGQALIKEFLDGYYGSAGVFIQKYIDVIHAPGRAEHEMIVGCYAKLDAPWLTPDVIANAEVALREAEKAVADDPILLGRVRHAHTPVWYMLFKRGPQSKTWAATEAKVGKLDILDMASQFCKVAELRGMTHVADGELSKGFFGWVKAYAALVNKTLPVPPELKDANPKNYRLTQACQMDARGRWWITMEGATDGWVCEIPAPTWTVTHQFSIFDDIVPSRKYKVFVRVKASEPRQDGDAFMAGIYKGTTQGSDKKAMPGAVIPRKTFPASELADGQFHAFEVGEFVAGNGFYNGALWIATAKVGGPKIFLDCIWVQEVVTP